MNSKKITIIAEVLIVVLAFLYYIIFIMVPDLKSSYGSSDKFFNSNNYHEMYEFLYDDGTNFSVVLDKNDVIYYLMFFDKNSLILYNHKIEGMSFSEAINYIIGVVGEKDELNVINYGNSSDKIKEIVDKSMNKFGFDYSVTYKLATIDEKARILGININEEDVMLSDLAYYSMEVVRKYKNNISENNSIDASDDYLSYAEYVYLKIEEFITTNKIDNLEKYNSTLMIQTIPANKELSIYPGGDSWYYVSNGSVYAYIEFIDNSKKYGYCFKGSIDLRSSGECD